ncbi:MAG: xanthine dehydrogenase family protein subunit M [Chloroflexi bacterium]|nr:xanthine dehydrogenase family protein subunit M [Chloroflexota bacterium]
MKPAAFDYYAPDTLEEALAVLAERGDEAKILAGGQSLVPLLNMRLAKPEALVDINRLAELDYIREEDDWLAVGAITRQRALERYPLVRQRLPLIADSLHYLGHAQIRNRGTIGGNLAHADPASELPATLVAMGGELVVASAAGRRTLAPEEFYLTYLTTTLDPTELLVEARFRLPTGRHGGAFVELSRRHGDYAMVGVAVQLELAPDGTLARAGIGMCGAGPVPIKAAAAEALLVGERPSEQVFAEAGVRAAEQAEPESDIHASADYRRDMVRVLTVRALRLALQRATAAPDR